MEEANRCWGQRDALFDRATELSNLAIKFRDACHAHSRMLENATSQDHLNNEVSPQERTNGVEQEVIQTFLKTTVCTGLEAKILPPATCELLTPQNAQNIYRTNYSLMLQALCGTTNTNSAKTMIVVDPMLVQPSCEALLEIGPP